MIIIKNLIKGLSLICSFNDLSGYYLSGNGGEEIPEGGFRTDELTPGCWKSQNIFIHENSTGTTELENGKYFFQKQAYNIIQMSKIGALSVPGTTENNISNGALAINGNKIWHYGIEKDYLKYAIIQEILCPDMINGFGLGSIKTEISTIPKDIYEDYLKWRISFFESMKDYWDNLSNKNVENFKMTEEEKNTYSSNIGEIIGYLKNL